MVLTLPLSLILVSSGCTEFLPLLISSQHKKRNEFVSTICPCMHCDLYKSRFFDSNLSVKTFKRQYSLSFLDIAPKKRGVKIRLDPYPLLTMITLSNLILNLQNNNSAFLPTLLELSPWTPERTSGSLKPNKCRPVLKWIIVLCSSV